MRTRLCTVGERYGRRLVIVFVVVRRLGTTRRGASREPSLTARRFDFSSRADPAPPRTSAPVLVGRYLGKHMPGNPGVVVRNMSGAGGLIAANYLYNVAKPDGLTILAMSRANYMEQIIGRPEVKADFRKFNWIGSFNKAPMMVACRSDTEYKSIAAIRAAKTPPRFGQSGTGSISYVFANLIERIARYKVEKRHRISVRPRHRSGIGTG